MTVEKHIRVRGSSNISWKDAIVQTISEASKTINGIMYKVIMRKEEKYLMKIDFARNIDRKSVV